MCEPRKHPFVGAKVLYNITNIVYPYLMHPNSCFSTLAVPEHYPLSNNATYNLNYFGDSTKEHEHNYMVKGEWINVIYKVKDVENTVRRITVKTFVYLESKVNDFIHY